MRLRTNILRKKWLVQEAQLGNSTFPCGSNFAFFRKKKFSWKFKKVMPKSIKDIEIT